MRPFRSAALSLALLLTAGPALAKDLCFTDGDGQLIVIQKVKKVKKPGKSFPVRGYVVIPLENFVAPLSGTAVAETDGRVSYGVTIYNLNQGTNQSVSAIWNPETGNASTHWDKDGDGNVDQSDQWVAVDCSTVVLP